MKKFKTTLQTMVIHPYIDTIGAYEAVRKVKEIGYNCIEISGHFECNQNLVDELCRARDDFGVEIGAMSVVFQGGFNVPSMRKIVPLRLIEDFDRVIAFSKQLGTTCVRYAGMPVYMLDTMDKVDQYCKVAEEYALKLAEHGIRLCMHNHETEFAKINGKTYFDWVVEKCPHICFEFDVLGAAHAAKDLCDTMRSIKGRMPLIHFEDIKVLPLNKNNNGSGGKRHLEEYVVGCPLGEGNVDIKKFCDTAIECGNEYFIIEVSNFFGVDPYDGMKLAADNLKAAGYADTF